MANTLIQFFHWYSPNDGTFWKHTAEQAEYLEKLGLTHAWLPPAYKSADGVNGVGYSVYDLFDLGEFDQKGGVRTKYGTKEEYLQAIQALKSKNVKTIADVVINHKCGGDELEMVTIQEVYSDNRNKTAGEPYKKEVYSKFYFPARNGKYSNFVWTFTALPE